ncbi:MAG: hypothetical protein L0M03_04525, partial [Enterococcus sp.]|nr:hypothetical protein [Enterococcus sp.]
YTPHLFCLYEPKLLSKLASIGIVKILIEQEFESHAVNTEASQASVASSILVTRFLKYRGLDCDQSRCFWYFLLFFWRTLAIQTVLDVC